MAQLSYSIEHQPGYAGDLADSDLSHRISAVRNNMVVDMPFGLGLVSDYAAAASATPAVGPLDNNSQAVKLPDSSTAVMLGVGVRSLARAPGLDGFDVNGRRPGGMLDMATHGAVYVGAEAAMVVTDAIYMRFGAGSAANGQAGSFRPDSDVVPAWQIDHAYSLGARVANDSGKVYQCTTAGTSAHSGGPTGTGSGIVDNTAVWAYQGICDSSTRATAILVTNVKVKKGSVDCTVLAPASGLDAFGDTLPAYLAVLELNKP